MAEEKGAQADPVSRIQAMLEAESKPPQQEQEAEPEPQPEAEGEADPNRQVEGEEAPPEDARRVAEIPLDQLEAIELEVTVKGEGGKDETHKRSVKELREGYMRQQDYGRKTAEIARQREEIGEKVRQAIEGERSQYAKSLQEMHSLLIETAAAELKDVNWNDLAANDPFGYVQKRNRADQFVQALNQVKQRQLDLEAKQKAELETKRKEQSQKTFEQLQKDIQGWNDSLHGELKKAAEAFGYKSEELDSWLDPRAYKLLHAAYEHQKLKAGNPADKRVITPPKVIKPGVAQEATKAQQRHAAALNKLRETGTVEDAAAVIAARMR